VRDLARRGIGVLFISSEIEEVLDVADRILIMNQGHITGEVRPEDLDVEGLMTLVMEEMDHDHDGRS
jgi:ABC-type sugar transport system ATPase subunit